MSKKYSQISKALLEIKAELISLGLWSYGDNKPESKAFLSTSPFFMDTMDFHQWLEFVLIPKISELIEQEALENFQCQIHTYAQEYYRGQWTEYKQLITKLKEFDKLFD